jgi:hypothetical protein
MMGYEVLFTIECVVIVDFVYSIEREEQLYL